MNNYFYKGNEMNAELMGGILQPNNFRQTSKLTKAWAGLIGVLLVSALAPVSAQNFNNPDEALADIRQNCAREIQSYDSAVSDTAVANIHIRSTISAPKAILERGLSDGGSSLGSTPLLVSFNSCLYKRRLWQLERLSSATKATPSSTPAPIAPTSPTNANNPNRTSAGTPEAARLAQDLNAATTLAQNNQAKVDKARQGKPKRHVAGLEAHNCLKPQKGGGVVNSCPYAVEYSYCVLRPTKGTWSESFDCEKSKGGSWQVGPGPNTRSVMHTAGVTTYWFACKYGETLGKSDGVSPADIEYQAGRGLLGRCVQ